MNKTKIEWVKNPDGTPGYTWNPITGCLNHVKGMCKGGNFPCFAYRLATTRLKERYLANDIIGETDPRTSRLRESFADPFYPRFWPEKLLELKTRKPRQQTFTKSKGIFVCDMSDLFGIGIPEEWTRQVMDTIKSCPQHRFYLLTKQPQNLPQWSPFPDNCRVGVTATNATTLHNACIRLSKIDVKIKYVSMEPLLAWWPPEIGQIIRWLQIGRFTGKGGINWLIIGAQTKPRKLPELEWVEELVKAADRAGIPVFLKNNLNCCAISDYSVLLDKRGNMRQEMPEDKN